MLSPMNNALRLIALLAVIATTMLAGALSTASASTGATSAPMTTQGDDDGGCYLVYDEDFNLFWVCIGDD